MTYKTLLEALKELTPEQLDMEASVLTLFPDEEYSLQDIYNYSLVSEAETALNIPRHVAEEISDFAEDNQLPLLVVNER